MKTKSGIFRVIDANLNRSREGLRVVEDFSRFILEDAALSTRVKKMRHGVDRLSRKIYPELISNRNSAGDVLRKPRESAKKDIRSVLISNIKRVGESLRTLEEFSKMISPDAGSGFKKIRFEIYDVEKIIVARVSASGVKA